ncbi:NAD(P)-dependent dehydrogenase, short-chain alcohol dehydrogenase family [Marininema mesophilum]|uniref:NAD(P)-dependent dehydrogenase, short-chain alcohol dehydrogenase family n=1 Tax=Marininema mesophilum TaxID=1048340 RepID=A0A1H2WDM1_9BACL|nr:glucose 1-dehydrogenase [Marininema mesophilum]SDW78364.1 NAD(P)-dependent dehydrogenase, short-chain alcohol dehydrogenase family [Marininema mesophilum]
MRLRNKVCVITGAGSGMGRTAAKMFAAEGAIVAVLDIDEVAAKQTVADIHKSGGHAEYFLCDVGNEESVKQTIEKIQESCGTPEVLYNNAGIMPAEDHSVVDTDEAVWDQVLKINVKGIYLMCKHTIPLMVSKGAGSIINIASFVASMGCSVPQDAYTASKGAVVALTKSLAIQFRPHGIRSNAICPGPIETPLLTDWLLKDEEARQVRLGRQPSGRFGRAEDIVHCAIYLASNESDWTNGSIIPIDGGITSNYF